MYQAQVGFVYLPILEKSREIFVRLCIAGKEDQSTGIPVDPVHHEDLRVFLFQPLTY